MSLDIQGVQAVVPTYYPDPFPDYYRSRNIPIAANLAHLLGQDGASELALPTQDKTPIRAALRNGEYLALPFHIPLELMEGARGDIYGSAVESNFVFQKTALHRPVSTLPEHLAGLVGPEYFDAIEGLTLPGLSAFSEEDMRAGFAILKSRGIQSIRFKPESSNGEDQFTIQTEDHAVELYRKYATPMGVVLEEDLNPNQNHPPVNISFGVIRLPSGENYYSISRQIDAINGNQVNYGGGQVTLVREDKFADVVDDMEPEFRLAAYSGAQYLDLVQRNFETHINRFVADTFIVDGRSYIADPAGRVTGTDVVNPQMIAIMRQEGLSVLSGETRFTYGARTESNLDHGKVFCDYRARDNAHDLLITYKVNFAG